ncbi:MAG TPA: ABC transporter permease [Bacteroidales bacterium]|nr:ABC transporter permease [Bacteroidales bacterium]
MKLLLKSIIRSFIRKPVTNLINLLGLTISFALVIILSAYCYSELTTDSYQKNGDNVYLYLSSDDDMYTPGVLKDHIDMKVPGVESTIRITGTWDTPVLQAENSAPINSDLLYADEGFFRFFTYEVVEGDPESALRDPLTIVITKTLSNKLFGKEQAIGKIVRLNNSKEMTVRAVIEEPKSNSCLRFSALTSMATQKIVQGEDGEYTDWGWCDFQTFLLLNNDIKPGETEKTILNIIPADFQKDYKNAKLVPLKKIYFSKFMLFGYPYLVSANKQKVILLAMVAILVLIVALVNFINISSSQWLGRIRQTGILKIVGARRSAIFLNILFESFFFFLIALLIAVDLVNLINPFIREYTGIHYSQKMTLSPGFILISLTAILVLSVIFSIIPAWKISSSNAIDNLKNRVETKRSNFSLSGVLVTLQFTIAIVLIAFTVLVQKQVKYGSTSLGFNQKNIIGIKLTPQLDKKKDVFEKLLLEKPAINEVTFTQYFPGKDISQWGVQMDINGEKKQLNFDTFSADAAFFKIAGLQLVKGRFYTDSLSTDKMKVVVNETFIRENNLTDPLGTTFFMGKRVYEIIGVVKDFHFQPVNQGIASLAIRNENYASYCLASLKTSSFKSLQGLLKDIKTTTTGLSPSFPVDVSFFDQAVENMYQSELLFHRTFSLFAGCAIVICCLGILAMSLFGCQRRIKEIGIRKVNGAKASEILAMLNNDFVKWVAIAFVVSCPIAWYAMYKWLGSFAYRTGLSWWIFALAGFIALGVALLTVSWQSWRAASRNPVESLRYE